MEEAQRVPSASPKLSESGSVDSQILEEKKSSATSSPTLRCTSSPLTVPSEQGTAADHQRTKEEASSETPAPPSQAGSVSSDEQPFKQLSMEEGMKLLQPKVN